MALKRGPPFERGSGFIPSRPYVKMALVSPKNEIDKSYILFVFSYGSFMGWIGLRALSFLIVQKERFWDNFPTEEIWTPRDTWNPFDPFLLAEGILSFFSFFSFFLSVVSTIKIIPAPAKVLNKICI